MPKRNVYHPSLRAAVCLTRNPRLLPDLVPYNTAVCWIRRGPQDVVALEPDEFREALLLDRISRLERQNATLRALVVLLITVMRIIGVDLERARVPNADDKLKLLKAIKSARRALPIAVATKIIGISPARYHSWVRAEASCSLDDESSCPKSQPTRINAREINIMHTLVMAADLLHMPIRTLALYAQRTGQVVACASTWFRIIADRGWIRPRIRLYADKPTEGIRAEKPNGLWHIDTSAPCTVLYNRRLKCRPNQGEMMRKGTVKPGRVPTARLNEQSGLKCTGCEPSDASRATAGSMVRNTKHVTEASVLNVQLRGLGSSG